MSTHAEIPMVLRLDGAENVLRLNSTFTQTLGLSVSDLGVKPFIEWIHPDDRAAVEALLLAKTGRVAARHQTAGGEWRAFDWRVRSSDFGCSILGLGQSLGDVELRSSDGVQSMRASPEGALFELALMVETRNPGLRCSIALVDAEREHIVLAAGPSFPDEYNKAVEGLKLGPAVGSCGTAVFWNVPVIVENIASDPLWRDLRDIATAAGVAACWSRPITTSSGKVLGAMALYDDKPGRPSKDQMHGLDIAARMVGIVIERNQLAEQLRQAAKMEALGVLAGGIAHDFNNLLTVVVGNAELAKRTLPSSSDTQELLDDIVSATMSASELCNQMLAYAGRGSVSVEVLECNALVKEIGDLLQVALSKKATLVYDLATDPLNIQVDKAQFRQVIMNLITNASDSMGEDSGEIVVETSCQKFERDDPVLQVPGGRLEPGDYVRLRVSDTGSGMSAKIQKKIFDPFFTTKTSGRGLGLAAVQGIVLNHNGSITLDSTEGKGTDFSVIVPYVSSVETSAKQEPARLPSSSKQRILVVDDEPKVRSIVTRILESAGYNIICANDGKEAVDIFRKNADRVDCVVLDLSMPRLNGEEAFAELRKIRPNIPVILSSGFAEQEIMDRFNGSGLSGAIQKPAKMEVLVSKVAEVLKGVSVH